MRCSDAKWKRKATIGIIREVVQAGGWEGRGGRHARLKCTHRMNPSSVIHRISKANMCYLCRSPELGSECYVLVAPSSESSQPLDISTAFSHLAYILSLASLAISGLKVIRSARLISLSSSNSFQIPAAKPATIAEPRAVVSRMVGRSTAMLMMSACVYGR